VRIIYLNCWYAKTGRVFFDFVKENSLNTDIFCFQEVSPELLAELKKLLPHHQGLYATGNKVEVLGFVYGEAIFVRRDFAVLTSGKINLYRQVVNDVGYLQFAQVKTEQGELFLGNVHGKARPGTKLDMPARLRQSRKIINHFSRFADPKIIGGDFNLLPKTESIRLFEKAGYRNLIKDFAVKTTRNRLSWENLKNSEEKQYFADYIFVSPEVKVGSFSVPDIEISDHLPLILDFEV